MFNNPFLVGVLASFITAVILHVYTLVAENGTKIVTILQDPSNPDSPTSELEVKDDGLSSTLIIALSVFVGLLTGTLTTFILQKGHSLFDMEDVLDERF